MKQPISRKRYALTAAAVLGLGVSWAAAARDLPVSVTGNIGVTSDYVWRGQTQTGHEAAISGGLDVSHDATGLYAGFWTSSLGSGSAGPETDYYAGWAPSLGEFTFDVGVINYAYPGAENSDFTEVYGGAGWKYFSAKVYSLVSTAAKGDDEDGLYVTASATFPLTDNTSFGVNVGRASGDSYEVNGDPVVDYGANVSMGDFSLSVTTNDIDSAGNQTSTFVSWGKQFDL